MVDERWQVKISLFGLTYIKEHETVKDEDLLWTAPEILRGDVDRIGYTEGDLYSFAIIGSEIITKKQAWDLDNRKETPRDIIRMVSKVSINPPRPEVDLSEVDDDVIRALVGLVRDCWSENPRHRPGIKNVTQLLRSMQTERKINLMDHVMNTLENYASELEVEVQERMKELVAEKKKSDLLLLRMLPKPVAEKLKAGECVQPESYNSVTVFFSDVVSFTTLASKCTPMQICMVDERWQVKISLFGLTYIKEHETVKDEDLLWTAPEILRGDVDRIGYTEGDLYSFAIIGSEIITKKQAWDLDNRKETPRDIIRMVSKVSINPPRPEVDLSEVDDDVIRALVGLVRDCWSENPRHRPGIKNVTQLLRSMQTERKINLMDHVMNTLENYASELEVEVQERMKELVAEKKKSDLLLLRMLPKPVAEKLKAGECVQPESYNSVTVFFSDVVSFTTLASKCTPMQVVTLLNELYTFFDETISRHDVYKVETIGDGYLCASGVPIRNGLEHIREICNLALELVIGLKEFRVPHLPHECISIRVGIHSGSVVAGVVGLTMPRYCLFGDTVNTSSRMESNGKAGRIHLSADAKELLSKNYIGYHTRPRGDVLIKVR
ncbi:unnamed protein product [Nippostrongylus brasiliensis]|uniref:Guanylate cyclase n=1 Tax=Nippostrongylus brasiliensis TaxID=27835 RepID=A0A0N4YNT5_NIPBR|nr:unnamed protein product [Nippostrongylus brasiliensis]